MRSMIERPLVSPSANGPIVWLQWFISIRPDVAEGAAGIDDVSSSPVLLLKLFSPIPLGDRPA